jgi:hypothetical protein
MVADADLPEERWPVIVAFALGVVLAGFVMVQLVRRIERDPFAPARPSAIAPGTVASAPNVTMPPAAPSTVPPAPVERATDTPPTPPLHADTPVSVAPGDTAPSAVDALDVVDDFRRAYEQRNVERLGTLFAKDAHKGDLAGRDAILADYRRFFTNARDLLYSQPSAAVEPHADHVVVRAPFEITYKDATNRAVEVRGTAAWTLVRRDGATVIRSLDFELTPMAASRR